MSILSRIKTVIRANANSLLTRLEKPEKMVDQYVADAEKNLFQVKAQAAEVLAMEKKAKRDLENCQKTIAELEEYARIAVEGNNEADAISFLEKKKEEELRYMELQTAYDNAKLNSSEILSLHSKMSSEFTTLSGKRNMLKAKASVAKARAEMSSYVSSKSTSMGGSIRNFERMEERINSMIDTVNAAEELSQQDVQKTLQPLKEKYDYDKKKASVREELEILKSKAEKKAV